MSLWEEQGRNEAEEREGWKAVEQRWIEVAGVAKTEPWQGKNIHE